MGIITHGPLQKVHVAPMLREFFQEQHLMHIIAGEAVWRRDEYPFECGEGRVIAEPIQPGAVQLGPAIAVIAGNMCVRHMPVRVCRPILPQASNLLLNCLPLLLPVGRHTDI
jgi:hypothetical protein